MSIDTEEGMERQAVSELMLALGQVAGLISRPGMTHTLARAFLDPGASRVPGHLALLRDQINALLRETGFEPGAGATSKPNQ